MSCGILILLATPLLGVTERPVDYQRDVKPILAARCYACHGGLKQESELRVDTAAAIQKGGASGPAVDPEQPDGSLLLQRVTDADESTRMPPAGEGAPLEAEQIAVLRAWIEQGAQGPGDEIPEADPRDHWAFRTPVRPAVPAVRDEAWVLNPVDAFIAAQRDQHGLAAQPPADKRLLLRRVYLDLIGLPPSLPELEAFVADQSPQAYEHAVNRLLESPQYGQRWGRHWMDIWRYSDWWGLGAEVRNSQKHIWHWRDWIIESLNADVPYDEMLRQMLAADELYPNDLEKLRATGYLARHYFKFNRNTWLDETVEHTSKAMLGLTLNCSKCHDHKYDPIEQTDYYRFRAFFEPYQIRMDQVPGQADYEQDGIPRVFDCHLDAPTFVFVRGDEKRPDKDRAVTPGVPAVLDFAPLQIEPVPLPPEAYQPGLRPYVLDNYRQVAQQAIATASAAQQQAQQALAAAELAAAQAEEAGEAAGSAAGASSGTAAAADLDALRATLVAAERRLAAARLGPAALEARAAADRLTAEGAATEIIQQHKQAAAKAERQLAAAEAAVALAETEAELLKAEAAKKPEFEKKLASAREALAKAEALAAQESADYTPLRGALKTLESPVETEEQRRQPFPESSTGRRSALARWITDPRHPLTARVAVNHVWGRHFNAPLVPTVFEFGRKGQPPTHPQLLDWLSVEFIESGWSLKHLHRLIVTSNTYRMSSSSRGAEVQLAADAENRYYWRMNSTRMEAQVVRDALRSLSGTLDLSLNGPSVPVSEHSPRRSLYFVHSHNEHHPLLEVFDDARVLECYRREQSIVPQQALALANSRQALEAAPLIATQLEGLGQGGTDEQFVEAAFLLVLANVPTDDERRACMAALEQWRVASGEMAEQEKRALARAHLVHALLNHNDFITIR